MSQPNVPNVDLLRQQCKTLSLSTAFEIVESALTTARQEDWPLEIFLSYILEQEALGRHQRRAERRLKESHLPEGKTLSTFDQKRLPLRIRRLLPQLSQGEMIDRAENILIFGLPGTGKTQPA